MKQAFLGAVALASSSSGFAQVAEQAVVPRPPEQAAGQALISCVAHSMGARIELANAKALASQGLIYTAEPPSFLQRQASNEFGKGSFARVPSTDGQVWAVVYDSGTCLVVAIGTPAPPVRARIEQLFGVPNSWKRLSVKEESEQTKIDYSWRVGPKRELYAYLLDTKLPPGSPVKGFVQVTIGPSKVKR